jgi:hypothetical protein
VHTDVPLRAIQSEQKNTRYKSTHPLGEHYPEHEECEQHGGRTPALENEGRDAVELVLVRAPDFMVLRLKLRNTRRVVRLLVHHIGGQRAGMRGGETFRSGPQPRW